MKGPMNGFPKFHSLQNYSSAQSTRKMDARLLVLIYVLQEWPVSRHFLGKVLTIMTRKVNFNQFSCSLMRKTRCPHARKTFDALYREIGLFTWRKWTTFGLFRVRVNMTFKKSRVGSYKPCFFVKINSCIWLLFPCFIF